MDILISSNLERLIYKIAGNNAEKNRMLMEQLGREGKYEITEEMKEKLQEFYGNYANEEETAQIIRQVYEETGYVLDTHTAVGKAVYEKYKKETQDTTKTVIASTASPFKFTRSVMTAIDKKYEAMEDFQLVDELSELAKISVPQAIEEIRTAEIRHNRTAQVSEMAETVMEILGI